MNEAVEKALRDYVEAQQTIDVTAKTLRQIASKGTHIVNIDGREYAVKVTEFDVYFHGAVVK